MTTAQPWRRRFGLLCAALAALAFLLFIADLCFGSVRIPAAEVFRAMRGQASQDAWNIIVRVFRFPKAVTAALAGAALAVSGLVLQSVFRNPLAGPDSLGIGAGASIGVAILMMATGSSAAGLFGAMNALGYTALALAASLGSAAVITVILALSRKFERGVTLLIVGLLVGYLTGSFVSLLVYFASPQKIQLYLGWTYGSFSGVRLPELPVFAIVIATGLLLAARSSKALNAFTISEDFAGVLGIRVRSERTRLLASAAILAGGATAFCGPIAFLGIAAPQAARRLFRTSDHRALMPASMLVGIVLALLADVVSQAPGGGAVLPINPLLALMGSPVVIALFVRGSGGRTDGAPPGGEP